MFLKPLTFGNFANTERIIELQNTFLNACEKSKNSTDSIIERDFTILSKVHNSLADNEEFIEIYFQKDFLKHNIKTLSQRFVKFFIAEIDKRTILREDDIKIFAKKYQTKYIHQMEFVSQLPLETEILENLTGEFEVVIDYLQEAHINPRISLDERIKVNASKSDILMFFTLLLENRILQYSNLSDLGKLINNYFAYYNSNDEEFKPIVKAARFISDLRNVNRMRNTPTENLKSLFQSEEFFR